MRKLPFDALDPSDRSRFIQAIEGGAGGDALISALPMGPVSGGPLLVVNILGGIGVAVSAAVLWTLMSMGFGEMPAYGQAGVDILVGSAAALFGFTFSVLSILRNARRTPRPYAEGTYVFVSDLVLADDEGGLKIFPLADAEIGETDAPLRGSHAKSHVVLAFPSAKFLVPDETLRGQSTLERIRRGATHSPQPHDVFTKTRQSPAWDDPAEASIDAEAPWSAPLPWILRVPVLVALVAACLAGPLWLLRNRLSEDGVFEAIQNETSQAVLHAYIEESGSRYVPQVQRTYLQLRFDEASDNAGALAALASALDVAEDPEFGPRIRERRRDLVRGDIAALRRFVADYPDSASAVAEIEAIELGWAEERGDLASLHAFLAAYPDSSSRPRVEESIRQRHDEMARAVRRVPEAARPSMLALAHYFEENQTNALRVRFSPPGASVVDTIDVQERPRLPREYLRLNPHMTRGLSRRRGEYTTRDLRVAISSLFPANVLRAEHGGDAGDAGDGVPSLDIAYTFLHTGYDNVHHVRLYAAFDVHFDIALRVPGAPVFRYELQVTPDKHAYRVRPYEGPTEGDIYDALIHDALRQLVGSLAVQVFGETPPSPKDDEEASP